MIILAGSKRDGCLSLVGHALSQESIPHIWFDQPDFESFTMSWVHNGLELGGEIRAEHRAINLRDVRALYMRIEPPAAVRRDSGAELSEDERVELSRVTVAFESWANLTNALVVTRRVDQGSNASKPFQLQLIAKHGLQVPETIVTNVPEVARSFHKRHGSVIYKSASGVRSIVRKLGTHDFKRLDALEHCPVQFQQHIEGTNIRVHVVDAECFAIEIKSKATDFRYAARQKQARMRPIAFELPSQISHQCVSVAQSLGLKFAGVDFIRTENGEFYCLEVNPMPAYEAFGAEHGTPVAYALASLLARA